MEMVALSVPGLPNVMLHFSFAGMSWPGSARKELCGFQLYFVLQIMKTVKKKKQVKAVKNSAFLIFWGDIFGYGGSIDSESSVHLV